MLRLAVAILMIFIQCFGSVGLARVVCFRGDGSICCICSAWDSSACCEPVLQEPDGCTCCRHSQNICDDRNADSIHTSNSLDFGSREFNSFVRILANKRKVDVFPGVIGAAGFYENGLRVSITLASFNWAYVVVKPKSPKPTR